MKDWYISTPAERAAYSKRFHAAYDRRLAEEVRKSRYAKVCRYKVRTEWGWGSTYRAYDPDGNVVATCGAGISEADVDLKLRQLLSLTYLEALLEARARP